MWAMRRRLPYSHVCTVAGAKLAALVVLNVSSGCTRKHVLLCHLPAGGRAQHLKPTGAGKINTLRGQVASVFPAANLAVDASGVTRIVGTGHACDGLVVKRPTTDPRPSSDGLEDHFDDGTMEMILRYAATSGKKM